MSNCIDVKALLDQLESADPRGRDLAASYLSDLLEANYPKERDFKRIVGKLIRSALAETNPEAQESMFFALSSAANSRWTVKIDWSPVAAVLGDLDTACLEHALIVLGSSGNPEYKAFIAPYLSHSDETIRTTASDALAEIDWRTKQETGHRKKAVKRR